MTDSRNIPPLAGPFDIVFPDAASNRPALPGSKSLTNRALLLAALAEGAQGPSHLSGVLFSDDTRVMIEALRRLGVEVHVDEPRRRVTVGGNGFYRPPHPQDDVDRCLLLDLGNAGTAMRFLTAACAASPRLVCKLDGVERMRQRPIGELIGMLGKLGADIQYLGKPGFPPLLIRGGSLRGGKLKPKTTLSSQYISALLMVAPYLHGKKFSGESLFLHFDGPVISHPYIEMTVKLMRRFGARASISRFFTKFSTDIFVQEGEYEATDYAIEPDASSASYFWAAAALTPGSTCTIGGLGSGSLQGDAGFAEVLGRMGARVTQNEDSMTVASPCPSVKAGSPGLSGIDIDLNHMPDAAMTLATTAVFAHGPTTIRNVGNWRVKETDRMAAMQTELSKLGARVTVRGDDLTITPPPGGRIRPAAIDTYDDHRMAMSFAILGLRPGGPGVRIRDPRCVEKTFPDFFEYLDLLRSNVPQQGEEQAKTRQSTMKF